MNPEFSALELLTFAIGIEEEGIKFYADLAAKAEEADVKDFMQKLSDDEKQHALVFQKIYDEVAKEENLYDYLYDYDITAIFNDYAKHTAFSNRGKENISVNEAIKIAAETEKITVEYYTALLEVAKPKLKSILERLIEEESGHYEKLMAYVK